MFGGRFGEMLIIFILALLIFGPEKLPRVAAELGHWIGRARTMARQFREQLEEEVRLEEVRQASKSAPPPPTASVSPSTPSRSQSWMEREAQPAPSAPARPTAPMDS